MSFLFKKDPGLVENPNLKWIVLLWDSIAYTPNYFSILPANPTTPDGIQLIIDYLLADVIGVATKMQATVEESSKSRLLW